MQKIWQLLTQNSKEKWIKHPTISPYHIPNPTRPNSCMSIRISIPLKSLCEAYFSHATTICNNLYRSYGRDRRITTFVLFQMDTNWDWKIVITIHREHGLGEALWSLLINWLQWLATFVFSVFNSSPGVGLVRPEYSGCNTRRVKSQLKQNDHTSLFLKWVSGRGIIVFFFLFHY